MQSFDSDEDDIGSGDRGAALPRINSLDDPRSDDGIPILGRKKPGTLRKAPQAPKRFKSSYILFFMAKQQEIKNSIGPNAGVGEVSKRSSEMWKKLSDEERQEWEEKANKDKERYNEERRAYTGPWQVPWKRAKKDPSAPKRPMSAFLYFSQDKRKLIKAANQDMPNTEISRVLGEMWKNSSIEERQAHIDREATERKKYKVDIASWRQDDAVRKEKARREQVEKAKIAKTVTSLSNPFRPPGMVMSGGPPAYYHPAQPQVTTPPHMASYAQHRPPFFQESQYAEQPPYYPPPQHAYGYNPYNPHPSAFGGYTYPQYDYANYATMSHQPPSTSQPQMMGGPGLGPVPDGYHDPENVRSSGGFPGDHLKSGGFPGDHLNRDPQPPRYQTHQPPSMQHFMGESGNSRLYPGYEYGSDRR